jgi:hypothetical protein
MLPAALEPIGRVTSRHATLEGVWRCPEHFMVPRLAAHPAVMTNPLDILMAGNKNVKNVRFGAQFKARMFENT